MQASDSRALCAHCGRPSDEVGAPCGNETCEMRGFHAVPRKWVGKQADAHIGKLVGGKYLLVSLLGAGGMGAVYVALQAPLWRDVALKIMRGMELTAENRARFEREARAVAQLDHAHVVRLVDYGVGDLDGEVPFMVMEVVKGARTLRDVFAAWRLDPPEVGAVAEIFAQLLGALEAAHARELVHRDIKPENVLVRPEPGYDHFVKVLDFGLARTYSGTPQSGGFTSGLEQVTGADQLMGTPLYMAPEQLIVSRMGRIGPSVDLYAVGVMLYEVVVGAKPYDDANPMALIVAKVDPKLDPLRDGRDGDTLDRAGPLGEVVRRAMAWDIDERIGSAVELRRALKEAAATLGPSRRVDFHGESLTGPITLPPPLRTAAYAQTPGAQPRPTPAPRPSADLPPPLDVVAVSDSQVALEAPPAPPRRKWLPWLLLSVAAAIVLAAVLWRAAPKAADPPVAGPVVAPGTDPVPSPTADPVRAQHAAPLHPEPGVTPVPAPVPVPVPAPVPVPVTVTVPTPEPTDPARKPARPAPSKPARAPAPKSETKRSDEPAKPAPKPKTIEVEVE